MAQIIISQFKTLPYPDANLEGQTIIVLGANTGLGKEAARHFVRLGAATVILGCRSLERGLAAKADIESTTERLDCVEVWEIDLSSYESVKAFAKRCEGLKRIDAVVANASIATREFELKEGLESTITVNVISTFLLILLLLPKLREMSAKWNIVPVITVVSSGVHAWAKFEEWKGEDILETLSDEGKANMAERYPVSKLLQVLCVRSIAAQMTARNDKITLNVMNPGLVQTELSRNSKGLAKYYLMILKFLFARRTEVGSRTLVHAATAAGVASHGLYFSDCDVHFNDLGGLVVAPESPEVQEKVWKEVLARLETIQPGIGKNL